MASRSLAHFRRIVGRGIRSIWIELRRLTISRTNSAPPAFIVGCGHSGTSLLLAILGAHPRIHAIAGESGIALGGDRKVFLEATRRFTRETISAKKQRWVEKTPRHVHRIGKILAWLPQARILYVVRDGRDVVYSLMQRGYQLEDGVTRWIDDNRAGLQFLNDPRVHLLRYEDLVSNFDSTLRRVLFFLGEDFDSRMREFHRVEKYWYSDSIRRPPEYSQANHRQYRNWQIHQPLFDGRGRWKALPLHEVSHIETEIGPLLAQLGYPL